MQFSNTNLFLPVPHQLPFNPHILFPFPFLPFTHLIILNPHRVSHHLCPPHPHPHSHSFKNASPFPLPSFQHVYERLPAQEAGMFTFVVMLIFWVSAWILFCIKVFRHHLGLGMSPDAKKIEKSILFSISPNAAEENARPSTAKFINRKIGLWCEILFIIFSFISYIGVLIEWGETNPTKLYPQGGGIVFVLLFPIFNTIILPLLTAQIYFLYQENWYVLPADAKFNSFYKWWYIIVVCFAWMSMFFQIGWNIYSPGSTTI
eukprot:TRINITY_DN6545_c0_g2_i2.p1 TRINITY_DN6545_c0_g2~~TRINITY_DN6545_c0_g2_i2.p1  ORF type:complete len:261 (+),score=29.34 TRINITY_DN6545_c0_g2_i2:272-1054(+)